MSKSHDYIPRSDRNLLPFAHNLLTYALANHARWEVPSPVPLLEAAINAFDYALATFQEPNHGKVDTLNKNKTKDALVHAQPPPRAGHTSGD